MNKTYNRINWENYPSDKTPLNEQNLNKIDVAVDEIDNRVITHEEVKATKSEIAQLIKEISFNESNGIFTITKKNGSKFTIDTKLEKIAINFDYDPSTQQISLTLIDGTIQYIDLSALITEYEFLDTDTVSFFVDETGKVSAIVKEGSIEEKHLRPNYLAEIKVESAKAESAATAAEASKTAASAYATTASNEANAAATSATNAANSATTATQKATAAATSATNAANSASTSATNASEAATSATNAANSATSASNSSDTATNKANAASDSATAAASSATSADTYAKQAQSYAVGTGGVRPNEATDNAKYYYEQAKHISQGGNGLVPMGTIAFANLPTSNITTNAMYNISNAFTSDNRFLDGGGIYYGAGNNVYYTVDGKWDVLASSGVTGVKGNKESSYRTGNVNLTPANVGAAPTSHASTATTYGVSTGENYGHAMASSTTPKANGTAAVGTETAKFARGDHVHPSQTTVTGNAGTATKLATARTIDGVSFNGSANITHYGTCSTAAGTAAKVVACTGFTLVTGATIRVKFTVTNSAANPTLNVNSTGAKAIYYRGAAITAGYLAKNRTYEFVYNGTQYELVGDVDTKIALTNNLTSTSTTTALTAAQGKVLNDKFGGLTFEQDAEGNWGYKPAGADTVTPFRNGGIIKLLTSYNPLGGSYSSPKSFTFDVKNVSDKWETLTNDNFAYVSKGFMLQVVGNGANNNGMVSIAFSYNKDTGILTTTFGGWQYGGMWNNNNIGIYLLEGIKYE